jgi:predicted amidohydrolase
MLDLNIALIQADLMWEDAPGNLARFDEKMAGVKESTHLVILPEMFNTGFTMNVEKCAEPAGGMAMQWMTEKAREMDAVVAGSILTRDGTDFFNRFVWMCPDGTYRHYNKRHLFSMAGEHRTMSSGKEKVIASLYDWNINLQVCYDLRFPVWSKNTFEKDRHAYDVLLYVSNWPEVRKAAYQKLLPARAVENQAYVVWVNRVGTDGKGVCHSGDSGAYDPLGDVISLAEAGKEEVLHIALSADFLQEQRSKFRIGPDWDQFSLKE